MYKDLLIQATLWSNLFYAIGYPYIHIYLMKYITEKTVSFNQIIVCLFILIVNSLWNKFSDVLYKYYKYFLLLEGIAYLLLTIGVISGAISPSYYYIIDTFLFCLITKNVICGATKLKSIIYDGGAREKYDNTVSIVSAIATLIGSLFIFLVQVPLNVAFGIGCFGIIIDNVYYWIAYNKYKEAV